MQPKLGSKNVPLMFFLLLLIAQEFWTEIIDLISHFRVQKLKDPTPLCWTPRRSCTSKDCSSDVLTYPTSFLAMKIAREIYFQRFKVSGFIHTPEAPFPLWQPERKFRTFSFLAQVLTSKSDDSVLMADHLCYKKAIVSFPNENRMAAATQQIWQAIGLITCYWH